MLSSWSFSQYIFSAVVTGDAAAAAAVVEIVQYLACIKHNGPP